MKNFYLLSALTIFLISAQTSFGQNMPFASEKPVLSPTIFAPGTVSTGDYEAVPQFSPDGKTFYFARGTPDFNFWTILFSHWENNRWSEPQIAPFSGRYSDADEFITADGQKMFFISRRPTSSDISPNAANKYDIWMMNKTTNGWSEPQNLGKPVNSEASEFFPTMTRDGKTLYFGSGRKEGFGGVDLYRSRFTDGKFQEPENLGDAINTEFDEFEPMIAPDESFLIFMASGRPDGLGGFDLYVSYNRDGKWTKARNLGSPINSPADELSPKISPDGKYFFWSSNRSAIDQPKSKPMTLRDLTNNLHNPQNGLGDIYYIDFNALKIELRK